MKSFPRPLKIGTRGSPLALWQANRVADLLRARFPELAPKDALEIVVITTTGDRVQNRLLSEIGGKGLFAKEIQEAMAADAIHIAVHSMKDVETVLPDGFEIVAILERADPRDAWISRDGLGLDDLPAGAKVGTASLRRRAQVLARRPDLEVVPFRGNVGTRLKKLGAGESDATLLAQAGLDRLGMDDVATETLDPAIMLPAAAQGAVGVETLIRHEALAEALSAIDHIETRTVVAAERALLAELDGSCRTPIGAFAELDAVGGVRLRALLAREDGLKVWRAERSGLASDGERLGREIGAELRAAGDDRLFED